MCFQDAWVERADLYQFQGLIYIGSKHTVIHYILWTPERASLSCIGYILLLLPLSLLACNVPTGTRFPNYLSSYCKPRLAKFYNAPRGINIFSLLKLNALRILKAFLIIYSQPPAGVSCNLLLLDFWWLHAEATPGSLHLHYRGTSEWKEKPGKV